MPKLTKEDVSDLRSLQQRVVETQLTLENAKHAATRAVADLESILWKFEYEKVEGK